MAKKPETNDIVTEAEKVLEGTEPDVSDGTINETRAENDQHVEYFATIYPGRKQPLPEKLGATLIQLQKTLGIPLWVLNQCDDDGPFSDMGESVFEVFRLTKNELPKNEPIALMINSTGGSAVVAYKTARLLQRRCGSFVALVPKAAWSAATLLALGADSIHMGPEAALGPLDAQIWDDDIERRTSALNEVQALERLRAYALESIDSTMFLLLGRTGKKIDALLPHVLGFVAESTRPLIEKIDVIHYNERARILKAAEEYAVRLLKTKLSEEDAEKIAKHLVEKYPEHGFPVDKEEAKEIGLPVAELSDEESLIYEELWDQLDITVVGQIEEVRVEPQ